MKYVDLQQGTAAWLAWLRGGLGGSDAPAILGLSPWKTPERLLQELSGQVEPEESTFAMRRGQRLEPLGRAEYEHRTGVGMEPCCAEHDHTVWMRASLDGLNLLGDILVEIKWPKYTDHESALFGRVPDYYVAQVQHQLHVSGAQVAHYFSCSEHSRFALEDRFTLVEVRPDEGYIARLVAEESRFWERLQEERHAALLRRTV